MESALIYAASDALKDKVTGIKETSDGLNLHDLSKELKGMPGLTNFLIWNTDFLQVIEFSSIGVMRKGMV